jgi:hypothetical protein
MAQEVDAGPRQSGALAPTKVAAIATSISSAAAIVGVAGQLATHGSVGFAMLAGFGLAVLAAIVFMHQRYSRLATPCMAEA